MGYGTVRMARELGENGYIISVEADPDSVWLLEQNVKANNLKNVQIVAKAVGIGDGFATLYKTSRQANSLIADVVHSENQVQVPTSSIDDILKMANLESVNRISITINGAEVEAVAGMANAVYKANDLKVSIAGWYKRDGRKICDVIAPILRDYGLQVAVGTDGGGPCLEVEILHDEG